MNLEEYLNNTSNGDFAVQSVNEFWLRQSAPDPNIQILLGSIMLLIAVPAQVCQVYRKAQAVAAAAPAARAQGQLGQPGVPPRVV